MECSASWEQLLIQSGLSSAWTSAIVSTIETCVAAIPVTTVFLKNRSVFLLGSIFSRMFTEVLFDEQWSMVPSTANIDLVTMENSYFPTASLMPISGLALQTIVIRAKSERSSFSSTILSLATNCRVFTWGACAFLSETRCCIRSTGSSLSRSYHTTTFQWHFVCKYLSLLPWAWLPLSPGWKGRNVPPRMDLWSFE